MPHKDGVRLLKGVHKFKPRASPGEVPGHQEQGRPVPSHHVKGPLDVGGLVSLMDDEIGRCR
eukprot:scaffold285405_cov32-Tisochrysis_lutea.AAC.1